MATDSLQDVPCEPPAAPQKPERQMVVASANAPTPRVRLDENKPEERRALILAALRAAGASVDEAAGASPRPSDVGVDAKDAQVGGGAVLDRAVEVGAISASKLDFLQRAHFLWRAAPSPEPSFATMETEAQDGLIPNYFVRDAAAVSDPWARRLAWHATDIYTPIYADLGSALADDAAVCMRAVELLCSSTGEGAKGTGEGAKGTDEGGKVTAEGGGKGDDAAGAARYEAVYALTTHPGHHASLDHFGGYCFLNHAVLCFRQLQAAGRRPFLVDVDYHAGDGSAGLLTPAEFVSIHAEHDYPYVAPDAPWAILAPPAAPWATYEPLLREALRRRPDGCDVLVLSLGFDTLDGDPCAAEGHRLALQPADFGAMRAVLAETALPLLVVQEGGYHMESIPGAAAAFWG